MNRETGGCGAKYDGDGMHGCRQVLILYARLSSTTST